MPWPWSLKSPAFFEPPARDLEERSALYSIADPAMATVFGYSTLDGVSVNEQSALTLSAVYRAANIVAGSIASLPLRTLIEDEQGNKQRSNSVLDKPGGPDGLTPFEWKHLMLMHLQFCGDAFFQHIFNGAGALIRLHPVHPSAVEVEWDDSRLGGKLFKVRNNKTQVQEFDASTMTQIMGPSLDGLRGLGVVTQARLSLSTALQGDRAAYKQFSNGAMIAGLLTPDGDEDFEQEDADSVSNTANRTMTGTENAGAIRVLNKRLKFQAMALSAADAQFIESRTFSIDEIGRWFGVPPHLLGLTEKSTSWGQGIQEQNRGLARYTLSSWTHPIEEKLTRVTPAGKFSEFDYTEFIQPSPEDEINLIISQVDHGLLTLNEARKIRNLPPYPAIVDGVPTGADLPRVPAGAQSPVQQPEAPAQGNDQGGQP